ncbi:unnamed protein product [Linum trigynum]|uniref:RNase H type-1 domain-containing protein n=1 Tax=Linum trigynum TaxID=586398 RepID=A0AAV2DKT5_9ROSI
MTSKQSIYCIRSFFSQDYDNWINTNLENNEEGEWPGEWASYFALILWYIWKHRNENIFKGKTLTPSSLANYVLTKAKDWIRTWETASSGLLRQPGRHRRDELIAWKPPTAGWLKMNTDGAAQGCPGIITAGGVLRDTYGDWKGGFCSKIGSGTALLAELWGIYHGLDYAWKQGA